MTPNQLKRLDSELEMFVDFLTSKMGRPERRQAMGDYVRGLLLDGERKSVVPMATRMADEAFGRRGSAPAATALCEEFVAKTMSSTDGSRRSSTRSSPMSKRLSSMTRASRRKASIR